MLLILTRYRLSSVTYHLLTYTYTNTFYLALFLTTWHMAFAAAMTQLMARHTTLLDSRHKVPMDLETYKRVILPIVILFSLSLIGGNLAYLYLSVSFIQMLKVWPTCQFDKRTTKLAAGIDRCRDAFGHLGIQNCAAKLQSAWKCVSHRVWSHNCFVWRD